MSVSISWVPVAICVAAVVIVVLLGLKNGKDTQLRASRRLQFPGTDHVVPVRLWHGGSMIGLLLIIGGSVRIFHDGDLTIIVIGIASLFAPVFYGYANVCGRNRVLPSSQQLTPQIRWH